MRRRKTPPPALVFNKPAPPIPAEQIPSDVVSQVKFALIIGMPGERFADLVHAAAGGREYTAHYAHKKAADLAADFAPRLPSIPYQQLHDFAAAFIERCRQLNPYMGPGDTAA
ncbi:MAG: hypothetical protein CUN53_00085 [Phototrophicales bacterium]|nr:MAG: hypothetical protein CUN53_00085 [Phototrophicales bacterium]